MAMAAEKGDERRGIAILIGNDYKKISKDKYLEGPLKDVERAYEVFSAFGGHCIKVTNESAKQTRKAIKDSIASMDGERLSPYEWVVVLFCGHGKDENFLLANDGESICIQVDLIDPFHPENAPKIAKIPKLFFIDACRGTEKTRPVLVPRGLYNQEPRGGKVLDSLKFPPKCNMLVAYSTLPKKEAYESQGEGGIWINKVLTRLEHEECCSILDVLTKVNKDIVDHYQKIEMVSEIQQAELRSTLLDVCTFKRLPIASDVHQYTAQLNHLKECGKIKRREYKDIPGSGNHVMLLVVLANDKRIEFNSQKFSPSYDCINNAREKVAEKAVHSIHQGSVQPTTRQNESEVPRQIPRAIKCNEWAQELKNVLVDQYGLKIIPSNYEYEIHSTGKSPKFLCTFTHEKFPLPIQGDWSNSKKEAKQSTARKVLDYFYQNKKKLGY